MYRLLALCLGFGFLNGASLMEVTTSVYEKCGNLQTQENIQLKLIAGVWYVIEILQHKTDERRFHGERLEVETCPYIYLTFTGSDNELLKLHWSEDEGNVEYRFKINDLTSPGFWESHGAQNGSLLLLSNYDQFAGTVHVRKAVSDHMVLTFCSPNTQLYSLIVARDKKLDEKELKSITNQMHRLKLPITMTKLTCRNSSTIAQATLWLIAAFGLAHLFFHVTK